MAQEPKDKTTNLPSLVYLAFASKMTDFSFSLTLIVPFRAAVLKWIMVSGSWPCPSAD